MRILTNVTFSYATMLGYYGKDFLEYRQLMYITDFAQQPWTADMEF